jgi:putative iron-dependent peroxidase
MLNNMFIGDPPGNTDRILDFSTALTGSMFFTPTADVLDDPPPLADSAAEEEPPAAPVVPEARDGSLGIGSLKGTTQ